MARKIAAEGKDLRRADSFRPSMSNRVRGPRKAVVLWGHKICSVSSKS